MGLLPASLLVLIYTFQYRGLVLAQSTLSGSVSLPSEISKSVPNCALKCFESFVELNFLTSTCSASPTLDCLCSHASTTGFTPGEGALQCVIGEESVGFCTGDDTTQQAKALAYNMCSGQPNAIQPTHATITATIIIQTAASSSTIGTTTISSNISSTTDVRSSSRLTLTKSTTTATASSSTQTAKATPSPQESSQVPQPGPPTLALSKSQIIGIVVGGVGVVAVAVGIVLLLACLRRRRMKRLQRERDSDMFPFQESPANSMEIGFRGPMERKQATLHAPGGTLNGVAAKVGHPAQSPMTVIPQIPPRVLTDPNMFSRRLINAEEIGLAISPETKANRDLGRKPSTLLPDKPSLRVVTSPQVNSLQQQSLNNPPSRVPASNIQNRESTATDFEMDSAVTPYESSRHNSVYQHPRVEWPPVEPLANSIALPAEAAIKPLQIRKNDVPRHPQLSVVTQSFSQPLESRTAASSIYSAYPSYVSEFNSNTASDHWMPPKPNKRQPPRASEYAQYNPYAEQSKAPTRPFDINPDIIPEPKTPDARTAELSPVQESPVGRSPVNYPKIPGRLSDPAMKDMWVKRHGPPPPKPVYEPYNPVTSLKKTEIGVAENRYPPSRQADPELWRRAEEEAEEQRKKQQEQYRDQVAQNAMLNAIYTEDSAATRTNSQMSNYSTKSSSSSLLAKRREKNGRLGPSLMLASPIDVKRKQQAQWRVVNDQGIKAAQSSDWRPMAGRHQVTRTEMERGELPSTPGWKPKLTPTRRGEDLFLNVQ